MDITQQLTELCFQMELEQDGGEKHAIMAMRNSVKHDLPISHALLPNGRRISLLKTHLSSVCERNCLYCAFRAGRDFRRSGISPSELARAFSAFHRAGLVEGIFLSSGIVTNGIRTQDRLIDSADILRKKYHFSGYIHLKIMPGAEFSQVERAMQLADRVSINLEAPNSSRLEKLAPHKNFEAELLQVIRWTNEIRKQSPWGAAYKNRWPSISTQFVVGAAGESDVELLGTTDHLYRTQGLARAYFSAFTPVLDTPLESNQPGSLLRQRRLYQASFLLRDYGFMLEDLPFEGCGDLPHDRDPKLAWADANLRQQPVEINRADINELLRVPGIGPKTARMICENRIQSKMHGFSDLRKLGVQVERARPYILIDGRTSFHQLDFWSLNAA